MENQAAVEKCFNTDCNKFNKSTHNGCSRSWEEGYISISSVCGDFKNEVDIEQTEEINFDGADLCESCALDYDSCGSTTAVFFVSEQDGKYVDKVIRCESYVAKEEQAEPAAFICDETSATFARMLPVELTAEEQAAMGAEMARLINIWTKAKLDKQAFDNSMKNLIDSTEEDYIQIAAKAATGAEERPVACYWQMDRQHGLKRLYRCDTGALVEEANMELLDYKNDVAGELEDSIVNVQNMAQGQASESQEGECVEVDTDKPKIKKAAQKSNLTMNGLILPKR